MRICEDLDSLHEVNRVWRSSGCSIALVPTMGNLHDGHMQLVRTAREIADRVVVSVFVNPMQFGKAEDFGSYPRTLDEDCTKLKSEAVDALFMPGSSLVYPDGVENSTIVEVPQLSDTLCGKHRPTHFRGVTTVVNKLLNFVRPDFAVFGEKDFQQLQIIKRMVKDLAMPVRVVSVSTMREPSGLAMSSRNQYLSAEQREQANVLYLTLTQIAEQVYMGQHNFQKLEENAIKRLENAGFTVDYVSICNPSTLLPAEQTDTKLSVLGAAWLGKTRLIDNIQVHL